MSVPVSSRFRDRADFGPTIDAAGERLGISATAVEKDYWVSEVLRVMASEFAGDFILKGGTSLSKGYRLVRRFSEDIDILVLPGGRGRGALDGLMRRVAELAAAGVGGTVTRVGEAETGRHRSYEIHYPALRSATGPIRTTVLLEMGVRGGADPFESVAIGCLLGDALAEAGSDIAEFSDLEPFEVSVLHPGRTLLEKLAGVHAEAGRLAANPALAADSRTGRHFYDIYQLLAHQPVRDLLADRVAREKILEEVAEITRTYFTKANETVDLRPPGGFADSPAFQLESDVSARLRSAYEATMPDLYFAQDPLPSWEAIAKRVIEHRDLL